MIRSEGHDPGAARAAAGPRPRAGATHASEVLHVGAVLLRRLAAVVRLDVRGPEHEVVAQELQNRGAVLVLLVVHVSHDFHGLVEGALGERAGLVRRAEDLVVEDREVEREAEADGVRAGQLVVGDHRGGLVGVMRGLRDGTLLVVGGKLREVAVVVALHLQVEDLGLVVGRLRDEFGAEQLQHVLALAVELLLDAHAVAADELHGLGAPLGLPVLHGVHRAPSRPACAHGVLVADGQQVPFVEAELHAHRGHPLHVLDHVLVALRLLGQARHEDVLRAGARHDSGDGKGWASQVWAGRCGLEP
mmetsp:Transcript_75886/g.234952  ORF Transcript_75886/g.234952 Transcript_75886/m.234952 type:complete len:304 (+) Transcript_75886:73-984(+)